MRNIVSLPQFLQKLFKISLDLLKKTSHLCNANKNENFFIVKV